MNSIFSIFNGNTKVLQLDIDSKNDFINNKIKNSKFLVIGGGGSIGQAITKDIFLRGPLKLHVVDISENNLAELVRDLRSSLGYIKGDFKTFAIDCGSIEFVALMSQEGPYDYVLNLSALKHVRSEKDPYTLMRMIDVNIINTIKTIDLSIKANVKKYFCVSTDKATNPANMMGASKRIMEMFLMLKSNEINISTARFANVAFSNGSLLDSFTKRIQKRQPIVAPNDIKRYFISADEAGKLCLASTILGNNSEIFFPKLNEELHLINLQNIAEKYVKSQGYKVYQCKNEVEARRLVKTLPDQGMWPCLFTKTDTTGEKEYEEFYTDSEEVDLDRFESIGIVMNSKKINSNILYDFLKEVNNFKRNMRWTKNDILHEFKKIIPEFKHIELDKSLDEKM